jgi:uncharacterized integral membrane protein
MSHDNADRGGSPESGGPNLPSFKLIGALVLVAAVAIFFFQNGDSSQVEFLWMDVDWSVRTVIIVSIAAGVLLDRVFLWQWRRARERKAQQRASR